MISEIPELIYMSDNDEHHHLVDEFADASATLTNGHTTAFSGAKAKGKRVLQCAVAGIATLGTAIAISTTQVRCSPTSLMPDNTVITVQVSQSLGDTAAPDITYTLAEISGTVLMQKVMPCKTTTLHFSGLLYATTYRLTFTASDENGTQAIGSFTFTTSKKENEPALLTQGSAPPEQAFSSESASFSSAAPPEAASSRSATDSASSSDASSSSVAASQSNAQSQSSSVSSSSSASTSVPPSSSSIVSSDSNSNSASESTSVPDIVPGVISPNINPPTGGYGGKVDGGFIASATFLTDGATPLATAVYIDGILQTDAPLYYTQSDDGLQYVLTAYLENTVTPGSHSVYFTMDYLTPQNTTAVATTAAATLQNECMQPAATPAITGTDDGGSYTVTVTGGGAYYGVAGAVEVTVTLSDSGSGQWAQTVSCVLDAATGRYTYTAAFPGLPAAQYCASAECSYQTSTFSETLVDSTNFVSVP